MRHTVATLMLADGMDVKYVTTMLGQIGPVHLRTYYHPTAETARTAMRDHSAGLTALGI